MAGHIAQEILRELPIQDWEKPKSGGAPRGRTNANKTQKPIEAREIENKFWQTRVYTRVMSWGRDFLNVKS